MHIKVWRVLLECGAVGSKVWDRVWRNVPILSLPTRSILTPWFSTATLEIYYIGKLRNYTRMCSPIIKKFMQSIQYLGFPCGSAGKESACNAGDLGLIPGLGRSPGEGKGYPLQYSGLENSMDCIVHEVVKSWTDWATFTSLHFFTQYLSQKISNINQTSVQFSSVQSLSRVRLFATPRIAARQASLSVTISQSSYKLTSIESMMPSNHLILCRQLLLQLPIFPSIRDISKWVSSSHEVAKVLELQL